MSAHTIAATISISLFLALLSGCGTSRPTEPPQSLQCDINKYTAKDIYDDWRTYRLMNIKTKALEDEHPSFNVLSLSAGGEFGAYGAGFLVGWKNAGDNALPGRRNDIQVVTGVSTGAILATHAFLGLDEEIENKYKSLSGEKIYQSRMPITYLWSNSLYDTTNKDHLISDNLPSKLIDKVADEDGKGRFLYIGMVNLDTGEFVRVNMVRLAHDIQPKETRDLCYKAVIGASSAIPVAFSPKFIDGAMWVDGGARRHLFITEPPHEALGQGVTRRLYAFVHGDMSVGSSEVTNGVIQIAGRTAELFTDQGLKDSIRLQESLATQCPEGFECGPTHRLFETYYAAAASAAQICKPTLAECSSNESSSADDTFCNPFMVCLAEQGEKDGYEYGSGESHWLSIHDLCLGTDPNCGQASTVTRTLGQ